ncbi:SO2930 family diheme c-type cytochrome [Fibrella aquatica]|uniref:SO2930 family diheme c-type cytochrome n=1 Tax=Fibrella aquatica TaxID=3242487 RepID=UPI00352160E9
MTAHSAYKYLTVASLLAAIWFVSAGWRTVAISEKLSDYGFFAGNPANQKPVTGVVPYALNTPLFTDYAEKLRFVKLPAGKTVTYNDSAVLAFPVGTTLIKTFYYPVDFRDPAKGRRLIETRLLVHQPEGWKALDYVWNDEQTDAFLEVAGDTKMVSYIDKAGASRQHPYVIPNLNQCKGCHNRNETMTPIGPSVRQLNGNLTYASGPENQLTHWQQRSMLTEMPALENCPKAPIWNDPTTGSLNDRARIWLDINCAHCHNPKGPAMTSGLNLSMSEKDPTAIGLMKTPVAAGRGSGGRSYDIVPGKPDESILIYRLHSTDPGVMMPELGRKTVHTESLALLRDWISTLP